MIALDRKNVSNFNDKSTVTFFDILKMNYIYTVVDLLKKMHFEGSTIFHTKNAMFVQVNPLKMNLFF
jgi:hypothetical protein